MAAIGLNITITGYVGKLLIVWKKNSNILAEVGRSAPLDFPYDDIYTIADLVSAVYLVEFWRSDDGSTLNQFIKSWEVDASKSAVYGETRYEYVVGRGNSGTTPNWADPAEGDLELNDERLTGSTHENTRISSRGYGSYRSDEIEFLVGGGFKDALGNLIFAEGDTFFADVLNKSDLVPSVDGGGSSDYNDVKELRDDVDQTMDFDSSFYKKLCYTAFIGAVGNIIMPALALIPDTKVKFQTHGGSQNYLAIKFNLGETVKFLGEDVNIIWLAKGEELELLFKSNVCYVIYYNGNAKNRGRVVGDYKDRTNTGMYLLADEDTGILTKADYPALYAFVQSLTGAVDFATWATNKRKWGLNAIGETFRVPHLSGMARKFRTDASEATGTYEADGVGSFDAEITIDKTDLAQTQTGSGKLVGGGGLAEPSDSVVTATLNTGKSETTVKAFKEIPLIYL